MLSVGEKAPDFTVEMAGGDAYNDLEEFTLSAALRKGSVVLAFVPAAFTSTCTEEVCAFRDRMAAFDQLDAHVYGVSVDLPFAQNIWIQEEQLNFPMLSDWRHEVIEAYDVVLPDLYGTIEAAERSIFVIDGEGIIQYTWVQEEDSPEFSEVLAEVRSAVQAIG